MKGKRYILAVIGLLSAVLTGCTHNADEDIVVKQTVGVRLQRPAETKVTGSDEALLVGEQKVNSVQIFVFNAGGSYDASAYFDNITGNEFSEEIEVTAGTGKTFCAVVNADELNEPASLSSLENIWADLTDNGLASVVMYGEKESDIVSSGVEVVVPVDRVLSKVVISDVSADFSDSRLVSVTIDRFYLTNVVPSVQLGGASVPSASLWYHRRGYANEGSSVEAFLTDAIGETLASGQSLGEQHSFYCCPNPTSSDTQSTTGGYTARYTRLVIETDCGYYHVDIPSMQRNRIYRINSLVIKGEGGSDPEHNPVRASVAFDLDVTDWWTGADVTENI